MTYFPQIMVNGEGRQAMANGMKEVGRFIGDHRGLFIFGGMAIGAAAALGAMEHRDATHARPLEVGIVSADAFGEANEFAIDGCVRSTEDFKLSRLEIAYDGSRPQLQTKNGAVNLPWDIESSGTHRLDWSVGNVESMRREGRGVQPIECRKHIAIPGALAQELGTQLVGKFVVVREGGLALLGGDIQTSTVCASGLEANDSRLFNASQCVQQVPFVENEPFLQ